MMAGTITRTKLYGMATATQEHGNPHHHDETLERYLKQREVDDLAAIDGSTPEGLELFFTALYEWERNNPAPEPEPVAPPPPPPEPEKKKPNAAAGYYLQTTFKKARTAAAAEKAEEEEARQLQTSFTWKKPTPTRRGPK